MHSQSNKIAHSNKVTPLKSIIEIDQLLMKNILTKQKMEKLTKSNQINHKFLQPAIGP